MSKIFALKNPLMSLQVHRRFISWITASLGAFLGDGPSENIILFTFNLLLEYDLSLSSEQNWTYESAVQLQYLHLS